MSTRFGQSMQDTARDTEIMAEKRVIPDPNSDSESWPEDVAEFYDDGALDEYYERRNKLLEDIPRSIVKYAWTNMAHLLLPENSKIVDMGCGNGLQTYIMAVLNPTMRFVGIDKNKRQINKANTLYELHNLEFHSGNMDASTLDTASVDAIMNVGVLHNVYSSARYNENIVTDVLNAQFKALKPGGTMFIRDFARPPPEQFVLLEMPDKESLGDELEDLSEADLLVWYSEHARPKQDPGTGGFFLEELPPRRPRFRLFRLPYKWAYEFIMRKDDREHWEKELPVEYTFFTEQQFRRQLRGIGARVLFASPQYEQNIIEEHFDGHFRLYDDTGKSLGYPPTGFIAVAQKYTERKSLNITERRPSPEDNHRSRLQISAMRNDKTGNLVDLVTPNESVHEVIPYRIGDDHRLKVYLHDGIARAISNTVLRQGQNIDGKRWSGHLLEPVGINADIFTQYEDLDANNSVRFARDHLGLKPKAGSQLVKGPEYYPSPDYIDELIGTFFLEVNKARGAVAPKSFTGHTGDFLAKGSIREFDAQQILNAVDVGMLPNSRLELQILVLFSHLKIRPENWSKGDVTVRAVKAASRLDLLTYLKESMHTDNRFKEVKGTVGQLRNMHSVFVEEGNTQGATTGLTATDMDFVISDVATVNTAVVLPITRTMRNDLHAGFAVDHLPVPQRHQGNGLTFKVPSFNLPEEIVNLKDMKEFLAGKFGVTPDMIIKMGESYFTHVGITPQRIYPFAVASPAEVPDESVFGFIDMSIVRHMEAIKKNSHAMTVIARSYKMMNDDIQFGYKADVQAILAAQFEDRGQVSAPEFSIPMAYRDMPGKPDVGSALENNMSANMTAADVVTNVKNATLSSGRTPNTNDPVSHDSSPPSFQNGHSSEGEEFDGSSTKEAAEQPDISESQADMVINKGGLELKSLTETVPVKDAENISLMEEFDVLDQLAATVSQIKEKVGPQLEKG